jgi:CHAD domain-containing protein
MTYRLQPGCPVGQSVRQIAAAQIEDVIARYGDEALSPTAVHETRKALKRLRALLSLVQHGLAPGDAKRERQRLSAIARSLAEARDAHVMSATAEALENHGMPAECLAVAPDLKKLLRENAHQAETARSPQPAYLPLESLQEALNGLQALPLDGLTFAHVLTGFTEIYRRGRKLRRDVFQAGSDDERFHDLRKQVQQHWRHLQLVCNAWAKTLRPQIALARELSETLGRDHDLAVLAEFARKQGPRFESYAAFCTGEQQKLRRHAALLARRLYAETPKALRRRIKVYWQTAEDLAGEDALAH